MLSEEEIIKGCIEFNSATQKLLYKKYAPKMYTVCLRYSKNSDEAKDLMQECFIKVYSNISKFKKEGSFEGWIRRIFVNTAIKSLRKYKDYKIESFNDTNIDYNISVYEETISEDADYTEEELRDALKILSPADHLLFNLACFENYSHKEISCQLSISEDTSRARLSRARKKLQEHLLRISKEKELKNTSIFS